MRKLTAVHECRYCGRVGTKQFIRMIDGRYRCASADRCQRRARSHTPDQQEAQ